MRKLIIATTLLAASFSSNAVYKSVEQVCNHYSRLVVSFTDALYMRAPVSDLYRSVQESKYPEVKQVGSIAIDTTLVFVRKRGQNSIGPVTLMDLGEKQTDYCLSKNGFDILKTI